MGIHDRFREIEGYALPLIRLKAKCLRRKSGLSGSETEDLEQEMVLDLLCRLPKYDPRLGALKPFVERIVRNKFASLLEANWAAKRDPRACTTSLNEEHDDGEGSTVDQEQFLRDAGVLVVLESDISDLCSDVRRALEDLAPKMRELGELLMAERVSAISRQTGIPRSSLYDGMLKLRRFFEDRGLGVYLE